MADPERFEHDADGAGPPAGSPARAMTATQRGPVYERTLADVHLLDYIRLLYKRRWAASTMFLLVLLAAIVQIFTTTPVYEARTRILIESNAPNIVSFKEVIDQAQAQSDYYQTQHTSCKAEH